MSVRRNTEPWPYPATFGTIRFFLFLGFALGIAFGVCLTFLIALVVVLS